MGFGGVFMPLLGHFSSSFCLYSAPVVLWLTGWSGAVFFFPCVWWRLVSSLTVNFLHNYLGLENTHFI